MKDKDDLVIIKFWSQGTMESGRWLYGGPVKRYKAEEIIEMRVYDRAEIVENPSEEGLGD